MRLCVFPSIENCPSVTSNYKLGSLSLLLRIRISEVVRGH